MRSRLLGLVLALSVVVRPASAQELVTKTISTTTCTTGSSAGCVVAGAVGRGGMGIQVTGTFVGTLQFEGSVDGTNYVAINAFPPNSTTAATSTTTTGTWQVGAGGMSYVRVRFSAYTSGSAVVSLRTAPTTARGSAGGGGSGTPGGSNGDLQFNSSGTFGGFGDWDGTSILSIPGSGANPTSIAASGADASIALRLVPKGALGYTQLGPDTYGVSGWTGSSVLAEFKEDSASATTAYGLYGEVKASDQDSSVTGIYILTSTPGVGATQDQTAGGAIYAVAQSNLPSGRTMDLLQGINIQSYATGGGTTTEAQGFFTQVLADSGSVIGTGYGYTAWMYDLSGSNNTSKAYAYYATFLNTNTTAESYAMWVGEMSGKSTNPYYTWFDSDGVYRVREDNTFNSVGQAIAALYNPQFTKYTAGAANFERCIPGCQWNSNVAEVGNEKGGTGTLRDMRLIGQDIKPNPTGFFFVHEAVVTAAPASGDCDAAAETNRTVYDSTNDNLYVCSGASGWRKIVTAAP